MLPPAPQTLIHRKKLSNMIQIGASEKMHIRKQEYPYANAGKHVMGLADGMLLIC